jgi:phosphoglycerate kinase
VNKKTVRDVEVREKRVFVRVDFNVPLDKVTRAVTDDTRIRAALPTIRYLRERGARVILCSHLGRPDGRVREELRLTPVAARLAELLGVPVEKADDCVGPEVAARVAALPPAGVLLLENVRFHPEEEANDPAFARRLADLADVYVNDAFGTAHRAHASTAGIAAYLPAVAGFLMEKELEFLGRAISAPERPFLAVIGGAKVSGKLDVLENLLSKVDGLIIGGGMACTFLVAQGREVGKSLVEPDLVPTARDLIARAASLGVRLELPVDAVIADRFAADADRRTVAVDQIPPDWQMLDIGPESVRRFTAALRDARMVLWNGPMGVFELPPFAEGTRAIAGAIASLDATTIVGGGDSVAAVEQMGFADRITHLSTGGGASLELLEGKTLPGVAALNDR